MQAAKGKHWYSFLLSPWVIFGSLILGGLIGKFWPVFALHIAFVGDIYLALLQMCIIPLIVTAITTSFAKLMHSKVETSIIRRMIFMFLSSLIIASFIGVFFSWIGHIGGSLNEASQNHLGSLLIQSDNTLPQTVDGFINNFVSNNIFVAFTTGQNIPILIFAILLGIALGFITDQTGKNTLMVFDGLFHAFLNLVNGLMYLLPIGLLALLAEQVAKTGFEMLNVAGQLILYTYLIGLALMLLFVFIIAKRTHMNYFRCFYHLREMIIVAFVSSSSFAALPFGITSLVNDFKLSQTKVNLFFPLSVCLNPVGSTYFLALVAVFVAHLYGQTITVNEFFMILVLAILTAVAIGSVPAVAAFSLLGMLFNPLGLPSSTAIVLLIAISNIIDPIITVVNICANTMATSLLSTREESLKEEIKELLS